jgi:hypothetical protein
MNHFSIIIRHHIVMQLSHYVTTSSSHLYHIIVIVYHNLRLLHYYYENYHIYNEIYNKQLEFDKKDIFSFVNLNLKCMFLHYFIL